MAKGEEGQKSPKIESHNMWKTPKYNAQKLGFFRIKNSKFFIFLKTNNCKCNYYLILYIIGKHKD